MATCSHGIHDIHCALTILPFPKSIIKGKNRRVLQGQQAHAIYASDLISTTTAEIQQQSEPWLQVKTSHVQHSWFMCLCSCQTLGHAVVVGQHALQLLEQLQLHQRAPNSHQGRQHTGVGVGAAAGAEAGAVSSAASPSTFRRMV